MPARATRLVSALTAGGVLAGSLLLGAGAAQAVPQPPGGGTVPATCGQTVTAYPGDRVKVTPLVGVPFVQRVTPGMGPVAMTISGLLCSVNVKVLVPVSRQVTRVAPPLAPVTSSVTEGAGEVLTPKSQGGAPALVPGATPRAAAPTAPTTATPGRAPVSTLPGAAPMSTLSPGELSAAAPMFAPAFTNELPSSFLSSPSPAFTGAPALDSASMFGSAFPGLRAGAPAYLGYDPASAVTTASQVQALPVRGSSGGVGIPAVLAVLALSGAAAFAVRRMVLGKSLIPAGLTAGAAPLAASPAVPAAPASPAAPQAPVAPAPSPAEQTALVAPMPSPAEETAVVVPAEAPAEVTSVVPSFPASDPAEVTAVTPAVAPEASAEQTGLIEPVVDGAEETDDDTPHETEGDAEVTGVLASTASH